MKALQCVLVLGVLLMYSCGGIKRASSNNENQKYFKVEIVQADAIIAPVTGSTIKLKKEPFKFKLTYFGTDHTYVSASWGTFYYDYPATENIFKCEETTAEGINNKCRFVAIKTGTQDRFNENKDLYVGRAIYHQNWFYREDINWHRMDEGVQVKDGITYAEVTVEYIYDLDERDQQRHNSPPNEERYFYPIANIEKDIYLVFATSHYEKEMEYPEELQREKFILRFE